jgi:uncharacterized repeat protein (TIGR03803 family)
MNTTGQPRSGAPRRLIAIAAMAMLMWCGHAEAFVYKLLHSFRGADGAFPSGGLIVGTDGNLYGVTGGCRRLGCGLIFKMTTRGKETILYRFTTGSDGSTPVGRLIRDDAGNLYGVTAGGGSTACGEPDGCGTVFRLSPGGTLQVLHAFTGGVSDGWGVNGNLIRDTAGNLYGATAYGGGTGCGNNWGCGTVYRLTPNGSMTLLYAFQGGSDGGQPIAGLLRDGAGNLYGTTFHGGSSACGAFGGCGVIFEIARGSEKVLHTFDNTNGYLPETGLIRDSQGNLYGGTYGLGATLYRLSPTGTLTRLFQFNDYDANGTFPVSRLLRDSQGDLFVTNFYGGLGNAGCGDGCGTLFELAADGTAIARHEFGAWPQDGIEPIGTPLMVHGKLYGVTRSGGLYDKGTVWVLAL